MTFHPFDQVSLFFGRVEMLKEVPGPFHIRFNLHGYFLAVVAYGLVRAEIMTGAASDAFLIIYAGNVIEK